MPALFQFNPTVFQQGDVLHYHTADGGEIDHVDGFMQMTGGFETMAYHAIAGGQPDGGWWGDLLETEQARKYVSQFPAILDAVPLNSEALPTIEKIIRGDLNIFITEGIASEIQNLRVAIADVDTLEISGFIVAEGRREAFNFTENWEAMREAYAPTVDESASLGQGVFSPLVTNLGEPLVTNTGNPIVAKE